MARLTRQQAITEFNQIAEHVEELIRERLAAHGITRPNLDDDLHTDLRNAMEDECLVDLFRLRVQVREAIGRCSLFP